MTKITMKWAWNPEDIGGRRVILVQNGVIEDKAEWQCLTDAVQGLGKCDQVVKATRTPNAFVHAIKFREDVTLLVLRRCQSYVETIYHSLCEGLGCEPQKLGWELSEPMADRLDTAYKNPKKQKPKTLKELVGNKAATEIFKVRDVMIKQAIVRLDAAIEAEEMTGAEAYELLKHVITGAA